MRLGARKGICQLSRHYSYWVNSSLANFSGHKEVPQWLHSACTSPDYAKLYSLFWEHANLKFLLFYWSHGIVIIEFHETYVTVTVVPTSGTFFWKFSFFFVTSIDKLFHETLFCILIQHFCTCKPYCGWFFFWCIEFCSF